MNKSKTGRQLTWGIGIIVILSFCLCITTAALVSATVSLNNNIFSTGRIDINLNDGKPVIREYEFLFEPGMTVQKNFFVKNDSTWSVYYKLYFADVEGGLSDILQVTVRDEEKVLYQGTAAELTRARVKPVDNILPVGEKRDLTIEFHYPEEADNAGQDDTLSFVFCADAVQTKNNPNAAGFEN